jgi:hypothetical protein
MGKKSPSERNENEKKRKEKRGKEVKGSREGWGRGKKERSIGSREEKARRGSSTVLLSCQDP